MNHSSPLISGDFFKQLYLYISQTLIVIYLMKPGKNMRISARNSIKGTIKSITKGQVNSEVVLDIGNGVLLTSVITTHAAENLKLKVGNTAWALIKSTEVMIAID